MTLLKAVGWRIPHPEPLVPSAWNLTAPVLTTIGDVTWTPSNLDKTLFVQAGAIGDYFETASTPLRSSGRRYFELTYEPYSGPLDQFGFASGPIAVAGGTLDPVATPFSAVLFMIAWSSSRGTNFWWIRQWRSDGTFIDDSFNDRVFPDVFPGDTIGWDVDLDAGQVIGVYLNGVRILPDTLSGADLVAWQTLNVWDGGQVGAMQFLHRPSRGDFIVTLRALEVDLLFPIPSGAVAWDS